MISQRLWGSLSKSISTPRLYHRTHFDLFYKSKGEDLVRWKNGERVFVRKMTRAGGLIVSHSSRCMGGFMKKISVIVRAPSRDFSPARAAIHSFEINGKIVKLIARGKDSGGFIQRNVSQIFPEYFLHVSSHTATLRNDLKVSTFVPKLNLVIRFNDDWPITIDQYTNTKKIFFDSSN